MNLDSFFGLEKVAGEILAHGNYDGNEAMAFVFFHLFAGALLLLINILTSPLKVLRPFFSWLGSIWMLQMFMALIFIGLAVFITKGDISISRSFYLYCAILFITIIMHADTSRMVPKDIVNMDVNQNGSIDFSFRKKGKIPEKCH